MRHAQSWADRSGDEHNLEGARARLAACCDKEGVDASCRAGRTCATPPTPAGSIAPPAGRRSLLRGVPRGAFQRSADTRGKVPETSQTCNHSMPCAAGMAALGGACFFVTPSPQAHTDCAVACTSGSVSPIAGMPPWDVLSLFGYTGIATDRRRWRSSRAPLGAWSEPAGRHAGRCSRACSPRILARGAPADTSPPRT